MAASKKTDNHDPKAKLLLRRYFLSKYHSNGSASVLDCCQAGGLLWSELRKTHAVKDYWGVDLKPKKGRLKIDSVRILNQPGWPQDCIDIDTYGEPWKHWTALLPNLARSTTIFLTIATIKMGGGGAISNPLKNTRARCLAVDSSMFLRKDGRPGDGSNVGLRKEICYNCRGRRSSFDRQCTVYRRAIRPDKKRACGVRQHPTGQTTQSCKEQCRC